MEKLEIHGKNAFAAYTKTRTACRGIVLRKGEILLSYETGTGLWMLPGGGLEGEETLEGCCAREIGEETGYTVAPEKCYLQISEFYEEWRFDSFFFLCSVTGTEERKPTKREIQVGMEPRWVPMSEAVAIFSRYNDYDGIDEEKRGIYEREFTALSILTEG